MTADQLEARLIMFGVNCTLLTRRLPIEQYYDAKNAAHQLVRSASSPGFHYGETRAAESSRDFLHKLKLGLKELRESRNTLRYIYYLKYLPEEDVLTLIRESTELIAIFTSSAKKVQMKLAS
ncbi:four helix bundle protein [Lewinella sp. JB7]|uniref:four helix bundle protein n=1 Tax=Lewinella sp. JB7 TaxID=2962887 RepID=UPI0035327B60